MTADRKQHRGTDAACGGHARAGMRRLAGNGDQFYELAFGRDRLLRRAVFLMTNLPEKTGRGFGLGPFSGGHK